MIKYKKILLKLSGEALGNNGFGIDFKTLNELCNVISSCWKDNLKIGIVIGGGNFWRGTQNQQINRIDSDKVGMLATIMNAVVFKSKLLEFGIPCKVYSSCNVERITLNYSIETVLDELNGGSIIIFAGGTGGPFFTTDTAAALRAIEIGADILIKGTNVDGIYNDDPKKNPSAKMYENLTFDQVIEKKIKVMDTAAFILCQENNMPIQICNINIPNNIYLFLNGEKKGTSVTKQF